MNHKVFACFIDYRKGFDCINHGKLLGILKNTDIDSRDNQIIANFYWKQMANVKIDYQRSNNI